MENTVFGFFNKTTQRFPDKDFQRTKQGDSFYGLTYKEAYHTVLEIGTGLMRLGLNKDLEAKFAQQSYAGSKGEEHDT